MPHPGGRPPKYKKEFCQMMIDYFSIPLYREIDLNHYGKDGEVSWVDKKLVPNQLPALHRFAETIGVVDDTLEIWAKAKDKDGKPKYPEFLCAYTRAKELQKWFLIQNGLNGTYNPAFAMFVAKNVSGMSDKSDLDITTKGDKINSVDVNELATELKKKFAETGEMPDK